MEFMKVMLVCNAGMSTGILAKKIEEASEENLNAGPTERQNTSIIWTKDMS